MSKLICKLCGGVGHISFGDGLKYGWPKCCGQTMELQTVTKNEIKRGVAQAMEPLAAVRAALKKVQP